MAAAQGVRDIHHIRSALVIQVENRVMETGLLIHFAG